MSPSENGVDVSSLERRVKELAECTSRPVASDQLMSELNGLVSTAARAYCATAEALGEDFNPLTDEVSTTEAVMLATALLKARDLNPFDLALWFSRTRAAA